MGKIKKSPKILKASIRPKINLAAKVNTLKVLIAYQPTESDGTTVSKLRAAFYDGYLNKNVMSMGEYLALLKSNTNDIPKCLHLRPKAVKYVKKKLYTHINK
jgi:hypothetical protein